MDRLAVVVRFDRETRQACLPFGDRLELLERLPGRYSDRGAALEAACKAGYEPVDFEAPEQVPGEYLTRYASNAEADAWAVNVYNSSTSNPRWAAHAYPLTVITIELQGTRHSERAWIIDQLGEVIARLRAGEEGGYDHDDDFGYRFAVVSLPHGPSIFGDEGGGHA
jgi:hypothetical protein